MIPTLMAQQVLVPTLLTDIISFDKITVSDGQPQVTTGVCFGNNEGVHLKVGDLQFPILIWKFYNLELEKAKLEKL